MTRSAVALPSAPRRRSLVLAPLLAAVLTLLVIAPPASAHARLIASDPPNGATIDAPVEQIALRFNEAVSSDFATVQVVDDAGDRYDAEEPRVEGDHVFVPLLALPEAGTYTVNWRVVSDDGHPIEGTFSFAATDAATGAAAAPEPDPEPEPAPDRDPDPEPEAEPEPTAEPEASPPVTETPAADDEDLTAAQDGGTQIAPAILIAVAIGLVVLAGIGYLFTRRRGGPETP